MSWLQRVLRRGAGRDDLREPVGESRRPDEEHARTPLSILCADIYTLVAGFRQTADLGEPDAFRKRVLRLLDRFKSSAREEEYTTQIVEEAAFALVALVDEKIPEGWPGYGAWQQDKLAQELFQTAMAGKEFFEHLEELRAHLQENRAAIEVYFDCLGLGFEGRYFDQREELERLIRGLSSDLDSGQWDVEDLSPRGKRPDEFKDSMPGEGIPIWGTALLFIPVMVVLVIVFVVANRNVAGEVADAISAVTDKLK